MHCVVPEAEEILINYLMRNEHTSPFEQVVFTFHVKMPIFVARQWTRHRTARMNEISGRYSVMKDEVYISLQMRISHCRARTTSREGRMSLCPLRWQRK